MMFFCKSHEEKKWVEPSHIPNIKVYKYTKWRERLHANENMLKILKS
jgi:hypothetical protein